MKLRNKIIANLIADIRVSIERLIDFLSHYNTETYLSVDKSISIGADELDVLDSESHHN